ncbi:sialate:O-sulfotransferase 1-like [Diadema antillarum]|uniref:sialate:O-sulfotransferase 1-like n=1 Tax=Diadema antillarum TaxID=105358 RepID=UPI003A83FA3B
MAGTGKSTQHGSNSLPFWLMSRLYAARVTILWVMTFLMLTGFILKGVVEEFCEQCELEDKLARKSVPTSPQQEAVRAVSNSSASCLTVDFAKEGSQELVALASYPGSGNTWLRHLVEHSTGIYTGSVYTDKKLLSGGFHGEERDFMERSVLGVKMHRCSKRELKKFDAVVFLVRNPYNAMVSEWHRYHSSQHTGTVDLDTFKSKEWEEFVEEESIHWEKMMRNCLKNNGRRLVVFYENLQTNLLIELARLMEFFKKPVNIDRLRCTIENAEGKFHRSNSLDFDPFTPEMVVAVNQRIQNAAATLKSLVELEFPEDYKRPVKS